MKTEHQQTIAISTLGVIAGLVLVLYAGLIPAGRWQGDEYFDLWVQHSGGFVGAASRIWGWSPRPLAEMFNATYFSLVIPLHSQLIVPALCFAWVVSLAIALSASSRSCRMSRSASVLTIYALVLLARKPSEFFYWPVGAFAYLIGFGGLVGATMLHRSPDFSASTRLKLVGYLLVAALSNEVSATIVVAYAVLAPLFVRLARQPIRSDAMVGYAVTGSSALAICGTVYFGRIVRIDAGGTQAGATATTVASMRAAVAPFLRIIINDLDVAGWSTVPVAAGLAALLAVAIGFGRDEHTIRSDPAAALAWAAAMMIGCFASIAFAIRELGAYCCERHTTLQSGLLLLSVVALSGLVALPHQALRTMILGVVLLAGVAFRANGLRHDYAMMPRVIHDREANMASLAAASDTAVLAMAGRGQIINDDALPLGSFRFTHAGPDPLSDPWFAWGIMAEFGKQHLVIKTDHRTAVSDAVEQ